MTAVLRFGLAAALALCACAGEETPASAARALDAGSLARCLAERGAVYYGAAGCKACRAQERAFGEAFAAVSAVECHPHAPGSQAERCVERGIRVTPTWLLEHDGREAGRLEGARSLEELAAFAECPGGRGQGTPP